MGIARALPIAAMALIVAACGLVPTAETPNPRAVPSGSLEPAGAPATGPIVELGSGVVVGRGWRYSIYPSDDGWCTQLETGSVTTAGCGDPLPADGAIFGSIGSGTLGNGLTAVEGVVVDEAATVWVVLEDGLRIPAILMPLDEAGLEGQAFIALLPDGHVATHLQALALNGEVLDTYEMP